MELIFVIGAYFNTNKKDIEIYSSISTYLKNKYPGKKIIDPNDIEDYRCKFIKENPHATLEEINKAMVDFDLDLIRKSSLLIADVSNKSTGLGIELGVAKENNKKVLLVSKYGKKISNMILGALDVPVHFYKTEDDLIRIIEKEKVINDN